MIGCCCDLVLLIFDKLDPLLNEQVDIMWSKYLYNDMVIVPDSSVSI